MEQSSKTLTFVVPAYDREPFSRLGVLDFGRIRAHAERLIEENGYAAVALAVVEALQRDCPFFFRAA